MKRWVYVNRYVAGAPAALEQTLLERSVELLRAATASPETEPAPDGTVVMELHSRVAGLELAKKVRLRTGVAFRSGDRVILPVEWWADPGRHAFPAFDGTLELEPLDGHTAQLSLAGSYRVPLGPVGVAADATVLRRVAAETATLVLTRLASELAAATGRPVEIAHVTGPRAGELLRVRDVMSSDPLVIDEDLPLRTAAMLLFHAEISGAPVVSASGELVGVLSERDLLAKEATRNFGLDRRAIEEDRRRQSRTAGESCSRPARWTVPEAKLTEVARRLLDEDISRLVVVESGRVAGIISRHDVLAALLREDAEIERAVQRMVEAEAGPQIQVDVEWGEVTLTGVTELRSTAARLPELIGEVDGVMHVDAADIRWETDDIVPPLAHI